jgi:hypothetical protein
MRGGSVAHEQQTNLPEADAVGNDDVNFAATRPAPPPPPGMPRSSGEASTDHRSDPSGYAGPSTRPSVTNRWACSRNFVANHTCEDVCKVFIGQRQQGVHPRRGTDRLFLTKPIKHTV